MGGVPFSVNMIPHWNKIEAWKLMADKLKGRKVKTKFLRRTLKKAHLAHRKCSKDEVKNNLDHCWRRCKLKKQAKQLRPTWLKKKAAKYEKAGKGSTAGILRSMTFTEEVRQQHRQIKCTPDELDGGGVEMVTMALPDGSV